MSEEIKASHFKTMEELLKHLKVWEKDDDYEAYCRFFDERCAYEMAHYINELQKENDKLRDTNEILYETGKQNAIQEILNENWVSKDKIRNKIKRLEELKADIHSEHSTYWYKNRIEVLKELLN